MAHAILKQCTGFEWDDGNTLKNWQKHSVSQIECEEVFFNLPLTVADDTGHPEREQRYYALGQTDEERLLFVVFTVRRKKIRVISARPMNKKEKEIYETQTTDL